jgi:hypothetical protein
LQARATGAGRLREGQPLAKINHAKRLKGRALVGPLRYLDLRTKREHCSCYVLKPTEVQMLKIFVEEAAALASIALFVGMIALWAQILPQL